MNLAIEKAKELGIGCVGTHNANHFGVTGFYSDLAIRSGMIGFVIANTDPAIAPIGSNVPIIGTNPIAAGIPSKTYIALDMATSATARGKILESKRKGEELPPNVALDKDGNMTTDPEAALEGSILPFGGIKGYLLAFLIEIMTGPLVGAGYGLGVTGTSNPKEDCTKGDLFIAIDPTKFVEREVFEEQVEGFLDEIKENGGKVIPGSLEVARIAEAEENGINVDTNLYKQLKDICTDLDIDLDSYIEE